MWIFTSQGMISVVRHRSDPAVLLVRARKREHLEAFVPSAQIWRDDTADYRWRAEVAEDDLKSLMTAAIDDLGYDNFKSSIPVHEHAYHDACHRVWSEMLSLQLDHSQELDDAIDDFWPEYNQPMPSLV